MEKMINYYKETQKVVESFSQFDKEYFEKVEDYMRYSAILRDEDAVRELIFQLALDLKDAEKDGLTAKEFFGDNPKKMVDELVKNLKASSKVSIAKFFIFLFTVICYGHFLGDYSSNGAVSFNVVKYLSSIIFGAVILAIFILFYKKSVYDFTFRKNMFLNSATYALLGIFIVGIVFLLNEFENVVTVSSLTLSPLFSVILALILSAVAIYISVKKILFKPFIPIIVGYFISGTLRMIINLTGVQNTFLEYLPVIVICIGILLFLKQSHILKFKQS
ncbi:ABC transporter permease [Streptococcus equinus]|uniref:ABC transporter permease n=1 Tax=Streptococcus equinus TaxID=1335 RepID=UPI001FB1FCDA|nr:ABC transporter permease [Streptococcus equinus]UOC10753.1 ABC transporter permease [Streptococcus equinus]